MGTVMSRDIAKALFFIVATLSVALPMRQVQASEWTDAQARKFFNARGCNACHGVDEMRIGPSYQIVATRYGGVSPDIVEKLSKKILYGGAGSWGIVPMISNPRVSPPEADAAARWILALYKPVRPSQ